MVAAAARLFFPFVNVTTTVSNGAALFLVFSITAGLAAVLGAVYWGILSRDTGSGHSSYGE